MNGIEITKLVVSTAGSIGASAIVKQGVALVSNTMEMSTAKAVCVKVGEFAMAGIVATAAGKYLNKSVDSAVDLYNTVKERIEDVKNSRKSEAKAEELKEA